MSTISELHDPWSIRGKISYFIEKTEQMGGKIKRLVEDPRRITAILKQSKQLGRKVPPPIIGYQEGARGRLKKRALMAYVAWPFYVDPENRLHGVIANGLQSVEIAKAFNRLGYIVDVIDWLDTTFVPTNNYDAFFGMHYNFERLLPYLADTTTKIYYGTGAYWAFEIAAEQHRIENLIKRRGIQIKLPTRLGDNNWVQLADAVIVMGNEFTASTYRPYNSKIFSIDNSARISNTPDLEHKDFTRARNNFLAFPSTGLLHKGLDLLLEAFIELKDLDLWVCGPLQAKTERDFVRAYRRELFHTPNIHPIGWTDIHSEQFKQLTNKCAFVFSPSCAEGMAGGILDCMSQGLIPLVSREVGVDTNDFGVTFEESSVDIIRQVVTNMAKQPPHILRRMAQEAYRQACARYSLNSFSKNIERILRVILSER